MIPQQSFKAVIRVISVLITGTGPHNTENLPNPSIVAKGP